MGVVYRAEQKHPVHRIVALKLLHQGKLSEAVLERFQLERDALAMMNHACVATILDAGTTDDGRPYFAMEYVPGQPIIHFADKHHLTARSRLELFLAVCNGVQHAHQKGIIHRDLKPSNILGFKENGNYKIKIIDFGLAKDLSNKGEMTQDGQMIGTPFYMSPEQAAGQTVDVRTDIYSLGLILYELLIGHLPFDLRAKSAFSYIKHVLDEDPPCPSQRLLSLGDSASDIAIFRRTDPASLLKELKGELDWIAVKALARDMNGRYESVADFAADIRHLLRNEPVSAGPHSRTYRIKKFTQRHRFGVLTGLLMTLALFTATTMTIYSLIQVKASAKQLQLESEQNRTINAFLEQLLTSPDPRHDGRQIRMSQVLETQAQRLDSFFEDQPELKARVQRTLGKTFTALGDYERAEEMLEAALTSQLRLMGAEHLETLDTKLCLADIRLRQGQFQLAEDLARAVISERRKIMGIDDPIVLYATTLCAHAIYRADRIIEAESMLRVNLKNQIRILGADHQDTLYSQHQLANLLRRRDQLQDAERIYREVLARREKVLGKHHPDTIETLNNLANALFADGQLPEAERIYRQAYASRMSVLGPDHQQTLLSANNIGAVSYAQRAYEEAQRWYQDTYQRQVKVLGPEHVDVAMSLNNLANVQRRMGHFSAAESLYQQALSILEPSVGASHVEYVRTTLNYIKLLIAHKQYPKAMKHTETLIEIDPNLTDTLSYKAVILELQGKDQLLADWLAAVIRDRPEMKSEYPRLILAYARLNQSQDAISSFQAWRALDPSIPEMDQLTSQLSSTQTPAAIQVADMLNQRQ